MPELRLVLLATSQTLGEILTRTWTQGLGTPKHYFFSVLPDGLLKMAKNASKMQNMHQKYQITAKIQNETAEIIAVKIWQK